MATKKAAKKTVRSVKDIEGERNALQKQIEQLRAQQSKLGQELAEAVRVEERAQAREALLRRVSALDEED